MSLWESIDAANRGRGAEEDGDVEATSVRGAAAEGSDLLRATSDGFERSSKRTRCPTSCEEAYNRVFLYGRLHPGRFLCAAVAFAVCLAVVVALAFFADDPSINPSCDLRLSDSPSLTVKHRTVGTMCFSHADKYQDSVAHPISDQALSFVAVGDWGRDGLCCQVDTATEMAAAAEKTKSAAVLNLGDNFYPFGLDNSSDAQVETSYQNVYLKPFAGTYFADLKWYGVLGNHDYRGTIAAQTALSEDAAAGMEKFVLPASRYYDRKFDGSLADGTKISVNVWFVDTTPLVPKYYKDSKMMSSPDGLPEYEKNKDANIAKQMDWLRRGLGSSNAEYKVVVGHHTIYTSGHHTNEDGGNMERLLRPVMEQGGVIAYICGHDHDLQHLTGPMYEGELSTVQYFVSGAGSKTRPIVALDKSQGAVYGEGRPGFMFFSFGREKMRVQVIDGKGASRYVVDVPRKK